MKIRIFYIIIILLLNFLVQAQIVFLNNPSSHIVAFNPAFAAINPGLNHNYIPNQVCLSSRVSQSQSDVMATGQYFSNRKNVGVSGHYNYVYHDKSTCQKAGLGVAYHLIFFNEISTGWGISVNYNNLSLQSDSGAFFSVYDNKTSLGIQKATYASVNFGGLINYENIMAGFSFQPRGLVYFTTGKRGTFYTTGSVYIKYRHLISRQVSATLWYNANLNNLKNLQLISTSITHQNIHSHAFNIHVSGKKRLIGGAGFRLTNFNYTSLIAKVGYNFKHLQFVYGIEPYWLHSKYSEIIHELSITFKFN